MINIYQHIINIRFYKFNINYLNHHNIFSMSENILYKHFQSNMSIQGIYLCIRHYNNSKDLGKNHINFDLDQNIFYNYCCKLNKSMYLNQGMFHQDIFQNTFPLKNKNLSYNFYNQSNRDLYILSNYGGTTYNFHYRNNILCHMHFNTNHHLIQCYLHILNNQMLKVQHTVYMRCDILNNLHF